MSGPATVHTHTPQELGWFVLSLGVKDLRTSLDFYSRLGFRQCGGKLEEGWVALNNGTTELGLFSFFGGPLMSFRGANVTALGEELRRRGIETTDERNFDPAPYPAEWSQDADGNQLPLDGAAAFTVRDPDGNMLLFDSVPAECARFSAGAKYSSSSVTGELAAGQLLLGHHTYCLNVRDIAQSSEFYLRLGLEMIADNLAEGWAVVGDRRLGSHISLFQGHIRRNLLNFRGGDVFGLAAELKRRAFALYSEAKVESDGSDAAELRDPDGYCIYLNTAASERLY